MLRRAEKTPESLAAIIIANLGQVTEDLEVGALVVIGGGRAARKPLLLLYALGHFQRNEDAPISFGQAEGHLSRLLREFGPPRRTSPACPFHHLTSDRLWTVSATAGTGSPGASAAGSAQVIVPMKPVG